MFGTTISHEYEVAADLLGLDQTGIADLACAGVHASFAPDHLKRSLLADIDDHEAEAR